MSEQLEELKTLLFDWEAGELDDVGVARVRELLRGSAAARQHYLRHQSISAALKLDSESGLGGLAEPTQIAASSPETAVPTANENSHSPSRWKSSHFLAAAAVLLICVMAGRILQLEASGRQTDKNEAKSPGASRNQAQEPTADGIALLTRLVDVDWAENQIAFEEGDALSPGKLAIESGFAQIEFFCGATVIVEGPAELELRSPLLARVLSGRMRAQVPPAARGFSLEVDDLKVVDLGTEFGLSVSDAGADIQVFDGEVELQQASESRLLEAGKALRRSQDGAYNEAEVTPDLFLDIAALESRKADQKNQRYELWKSWSERLRGDRRLVTYYAFEAGDWHRRLRSSLRPENRELDGAIVGARPVSGRWPEKQALEFRRPGDRVRVDVPGEFGSLSFSCWVKIDSLDRWYHSLFLTDHYNQGEPHWQILDTGQLFFSVRHKADELSGKAAKKKAHQPILSPPFWEPSLSGRWLHIATTYDAGSGKVMHYLNGEVLHEEIISAELRVDRTRIGAASIGNWSRPTRTEAKFAIRNLNGSIDEFAVYSAVLSTEEIQEIYNNGKP